VANSNRTLSIFYEIGVSQARKGNDLLTMGKKPLDKQGKLKTRPQPMGKGPNEYYDSEFLRRGGQKRIQNQPEKEGIMLKTTEKEVSDFGLLTFPKKKKIRGRKR